MLSRLDRWGTPRRLGAVALYVALLAGLAGAWPTIDSYARASALLGEGVFRLPVQPLHWVTPDPRTEELSWDGGGRGLLTLPGDAGGPGPRDGPAPGLILVLGAEPAAPHDPRVARLVQALARLGFAVLLPRSAELDRGVVSAIEVPRLVAAFELLAAHPAVRAESIGYAGLSAGASLAIVAAAQPAIASRVRFTLAVGPYYDAAALVTATAAGAHRTVAGPERWVPAATTRRVVTATLLHALPADELAAVERGSPGTAAGRAVADLLGGLPLDAAEAALLRLAPAQRAELRAVSPRHHLEGLRAPLYLLHDRDDRFVPWSESERLNRDHPAEVYHRVELFDHVEPAPGNVGVVLRDGWRLTRLFALIFREAR